MENLNNALYRAAVLTFEEVGFLFPLDEGEEKTDAEYSLVSVDFQGNFDGKLTLRVSTAMLPVLAENMLGMEDSLSEEMLKDVLGEFGNIICGNALPEIAGKQAYFKLDSPQHLPSDEVFTDEAVASVQLYFDEGTAQISLYSPSLRDSAEAV